jgi:hypothetical protein
VLGLGTEDAPRGEGPARRESTSDEEVNVSEGSTHDVAWAEGHGPLVREYTIDDMRRAREAGVQNERARIAKLAADRAGAVTHPRAIAALSAFSELLLGETEADRAEQRRTTVRSESPTGVGGVGLLTTYGLGSVIDVERTAAARARAKPLPEGWRWVDRNGAAWTLMAGVEGGRGPRIVAFCNDEPRALLNALGLATHVYSGLAVPPEVIAAMLAAWGAR